MKTLIFNGSPRKAGDTASLIGELKAHLHGEVKVVDAYDCRIAPCLDCRFCWKEEGCAQKDGMQELYAFIKDCDHIVVASPIYFSQLTGPLLSVASRLQSFYASRRFLKKEPAGKPKKGAVILCGGGDGSPAPAEETAVCLLKMMNASCEMKICSLHTDRVPAKEDEKAVGEARALAARWNRDADQPVTERIENRPQAISLRTDPSIKGE